MDDSKMNRLAIEWVRKPDGVGRVPIGSQNQKNVILHTYDRYTKEYVVYSYQTNNGELNWKTYLPAGGYSSPTIGDGVVFLPCGYTQICGIDEESGDILWKKDLNARNRSTPLFYEGIAYIGVGNKIYGFNKDGQVLRENSFENTMFFGEPVISNNYIYVLGVSNSENKSEMFVYEVSLVDSLKLSKKYNLGSGGIISCDSSGIVKNEDGLLFVGSFDGKAYCIDSNTQKVKWVAQGKGIMSRSKAYCHGDTVYFGSHSGYVYKVDIKSGDVIFERYLNDEGIWSPPIVYEDNLIVHCGIFAYVLDSFSGDIVDKLPLGTSPYTSFKNINGRLLISAGDPPDYNILYSLRMANNPRLYVTDVNIKYEKIDTSKQKSNFDKVDLTIKVETADGIEPEDLSLDLSIWGASEEFKPNKIKSKTYQFSVDIPTFYRYGNYSILLSAKVGNGIFYTTAPINLKEEFKPNIPKNLVIQDFKLQIQDNQYFSGAAILQSVNNYYGIERTQPDINEMGEYMDNIGVHPHHKWRSGSARILHSSSNSLQAIEEKSLIDKARFNN